MDSECSNVDGLKVCNAATCVQCVAERRSACGEDKPACNAQLTCAVCTADADCQRFGKVCDEASARCVACTLDSEKAQCGTKSCDPMTKQCTQTERGSVALCSKCVSDSECVGDQRCIDLSFAGSPRGGYCMQRFSACAPPFQAPPLTRVSRSGAAAEDYCGIVEQRTSCEAIEACDLCDTVQTSFRVFLVAVAVAALTEDLTVVPRRHLDRCVARSGC